MRPDDLPPAERHPHGTRGRYVGAKCRCAPCRESNRLYYHQRKDRALELARELPAAPSSPAPQTWTAPDGSKQVRLYQRACPGVFGSPCPIRAHLRKDSKGGVCRACRFELASDRLVPAAAAREHLVSLSRQGVGRRAVQAACDVSISSLHAIRLGTKLQLRRSTEARILAVDAGAVADHSFVPAGPTWKLIRKLLKQGWTRRRIAAALGSTSKTPALQLKGKRILAKNALKVARLYREVLATELPAEMSEAEQIAIARRGELP